LDPTAPVRLAVFGCGAITQGFHLPVLAGHDDIDVVALVDPRVDVARDLARRYHVPTALPNADALDPATLDAVLLATPARLHAEQAIDWMTRGAHVLVEKPMALSSTDAERMVHAATASGKVLSVGVYRRLLPAIRLLRATLDTTALGPLQSIDLAVGSAYTWPLTTLAGMKKSESGGGMLLDMGTHVLDLLLQLVPGTAVLKRYADNTLGGVESDCVVELSLKTPGGLVPARVELSRTRTLHNTFKFQCSNGTLLWRFGERDTIELRPDATFVDPLGGRPRESRIDARWRDEPEVMGYESFRAQFDDFIGAIRHDRRPALSGESMLPVVRLIEDCYARREPLVEPWVTVGLPSPSAAVPDRTSKRRVLVTGATGFIGTRVVERLHLGSDWTPRALARSPASLARVARMPVEVAIGDLADQASLAQALQGCDAVVHCGLGTSWRRQERIAITVGGTKNLVEAALAAGVTRFVHVSSISVYGEPTGVIDESTPTHPKKGWDYAESKAEAERIVLEAASRGLSVVVLRVAVVYGPFGATIVVRPIEYLRRGDLVLVDCADTPSNTVYVDNVAEAIRASLDASAEQVGGQVFNVSDDDGQTWGQYFGYFADALGAKVRHVTRDELRKLQPPAPPSANAIAQFSTATKDLAFSPEAKRFAARAFNSPYGAPARWFFENYPTARERLKQLVRPDTALIYRPETTTSKPDLFVVDPIHARVSTERFDSVVGHRAQIPRQDAMAATLAWLRETAVGAGAEP
jgi:predicted dehydrogenase/nucleoside-diphosphate-sugar epimerase